jgi:hypothetical protein
MAQGTLDLSTFLLTCSATATSREVSEFNNKRINVNNFNLPQFVHFHPKKHSVNQLLNMIFVQISSVTEPEVHWFQMIQPWKKKRQCYELYNQWFLLNSSTTIQESHNFPWGVYSFGFTVFHFHWKDTYKSISTHWLRLMELFCISLGWTYDQL